MQHDARVNLYYATLVEKTEKQKEQRKHFVCIKPQFCVYSGVRNFFSYVFLKSYARSTDHTLRNRDIEQLETSSRCRYREAKAPKTLNSVLYIIFIR